jgi:hypothetical protein
MTSKRPTSADAFDPRDHLDVEVIERALAAGDARGAILACADVTARLFHGGDTDPAVMALLLGVPGPALLRFQSAVRAAREGADVTLTLATECFAFLLGAASKAPRR